jgi:SSS family solute:Na+ symporter
LNISHILTLIVGIIQIAIALALRHSNESALNQALSVAALINGPVLGVFLVGTFLKRVGEKPALIGMLVAIAVMVYIRFKTPVAWTWYGFFGSMITFFVAWLASFAFEAEDEKKQNALSSNG